MLRVFVAVLAAALLGACAHRPVGQPPTIAPAPEVGTVLQFREVDGFSGKPVAQVELAVRRADAGGVDLGVTVSGEPLSGLRSGQVQRYDSSWKVLEDAVYFRPLRYEQGLPLLGGGADGSREWFRSSVFRGPDSRAENWTVLVRHAGWETVTVPAGTFRAARYERSISFFNDDPFRWRTERREVLWYAPEVGFWVKRQLSGTYVRPPWTWRRAYEILREDRVTWELEAIRRPQLEASAAP